MESTSPIKTKGPNEKICKSCGAVIRKEAVICPACGVPIKRTASAKGGFWIGFLFAFFGCIGGYFSWAASSVAGGLGGHTVAGVTESGEALFWSGIIALVGSFKIKNSKPIGWKLLTAASIGCLVATYFAPNFQPLIWVIAYGVSALLGRKDINN
jgi:hypothetical protein